MLDDEPTRRQMNIHIAQIRDAEKKDAFTRVTRDQTLVLQHAACSAAASLLLGRCWDEEAVQPDGPVFTWVNTVLMQTERKKVTALTFFCRLLSST